MTFYLYKHLHITAEYVFDNLVVTATYGKQKNIGSDLPTASLNKLKE